MIYLIVGNGKLAKHLVRYFNLLNLTCYDWHYHNHPYSSLLLEEYINIILKKANSQKQILRIILAIKDEAIDSFISNNIKDFEYIFHCSGALETNLATRIHPLMTFSNNYYDFDFYKSIPLITCSNKNIKELLPDLPNNIYKINPDLIGLYHALCVLAGNLCQIIWQTTANEFEYNLKLPKDILQEYLMQITKNFVQFPSDCLTGPLARNDLNTIDKNLAALESQNKYLHAIYKSILNLYNKK